jgi:hypothetical protein
MTLTEFLLARIAEDEEYAQRGTRGRWKLGGLDDAELGDAWWLNSADQQHAWRWYPDRVLTECEAKRRIVEMANGSADFDTAMPRPGYAQHYHSPSADILIRVQQLLALPYADHPDYREEWRP